MLKNVLAMRNMRTRGQIKKGKKRKSQGVMDLRNTRKIEKDKEEQRNIRHKTKE